MHFCKSHFSALFASSFVVDIVRKNAFNFKYWQNTMQSGFKPRFCYCSLCIWVMVSSSICSISSNSCRSSRTGKEVVSLKKKTRYTHHQISYDWILQAVQDIIEISNNYTYVKKTYWIILTVIRTQLLEIYQFYFHLFLSGNTLVWIALTATEFKNHVAQEIYCAFRVKKNYF